MVLSDTQIIKFQTLYKSRFGIDISKEEAYEKGIKLIRVLDLIYKPMTKNDYQELQERRKETSL